MTATKTMILTFTWTLLTLFACTTNSLQTVQTEPPNLDTVYSVTTKQLHSDKIPDSVFQMTNLRRLDISGQDCDTRRYDDKGNNITDCWMITELPPAIGNLRELTTLRLTLNAIKKIPKEIAQLKQLKLLDLTDNAGLEDMDNLARVQSLERLLLYGCNLTKLPDNIGDLKNLKELGLVGNNLDKAEQKRIRKALPNCNVIF